MMITELQLQELRYDADMTIVGTAGGTTLTASYDMDGSSLATTAADLSTTIGPVTIAADMFDEVSGNSQVLLKLLVLLVSKYLNQLILA